MSNKNTILLIDDDKNLAESVSDWLSGLNYEITLANSVNQAISVLQQQSFDVILTDVRVGVESGFDVLRYAMRHHPSSKVIVISGYATAELALKAVREGAFDFLSKPIIDDELLMTIQRAIRDKKIAAENEAMKSMLDNRYGLENIVGCDVRMKKIFDLIRTIADTQASVLITGESGTGKSMVARAIHRLSSRRNKPFVEIACGALSETLLESELFGHAAGAFTGAIGEKIGKFKQAHGGTIFLDEISTASPALQVKLLRVLQDFEFEPVGSTQTCTVDVRVILATNDNLYQAVQAGRFRQDLYYRVNVINIELPPLRERADDIALLAYHFLEDMNKKVHKISQGFTSDALNAMRSYCWPGNVRQLQNAVERAVLLGKSEYIGLNDLPAEITAEKSTDKSLQLNESGVDGEDNSVKPENVRQLKDALAEPERKIILAALQAFQWNRIETAQALGINRTTLYKKMKRFNLEPPRIFDLG